MYKVILDKVAIKLDAVKSEIGNIILPDTSKLLPETGTVLAVGPGKYDKKGVFIPTNVQVGDRVLFHKYLPVKVDVEENVVIVSEEHIIGTM